MMVIIIIVIWTRIYSFSCGLVRDDLDLSIPRQLQSIQRHAL